MAFRLPVTAKGTLRHTRTSIPSKPQQALFRANYIELLRAPPSDQLVSIEYRRRAASEYQFLLDSIEAHKEFRKRFPPSKTTYREYISKSALRCGLVPPKFWDEDPHLPDHLKSKTKGQKEIYEFQER